jgi:RNA polymerase sigma factor for flagellar operon FliA
MHRAIANYVTAAGSKEEAETLQRHGHLVERVARRLVMRTGAHGAYDDLWSAGALGLLEAMRRFDAGRGATFETFAEHRIRGAMLDELRRLDHLPRRLRSRTDDLQKARRKLAASLGREPTTDEVAAELEVDVDEAAAMESLLEAPVTLDSALPFLTTEGSLEDPMLRAEALRGMASAIERLPERLQLVLSLHYVEDLTYKEIGQLLQVSEPRVCQLHADALKKMRAMLEADDVAGDAE